MLLAHELAGDDGAPAIVLVHGITESRETWRPIIEALAADHRVLAVDLRGHGASEHEPPYDPAHYGGDVAETIAAAGLIEPLIVGHSLGGVVVTAVPAFCPAVVGGGQRRPAAGARRLPRRAAAARADAARHRPRSFARRSTWCSTA